MQNTNIQDYKIIIIDADNRYGEAFAAEASSLGYRVDYFRNVIDLGFLGNLSKYDAALIGENIGQLSPVEMADYFGKILDTIPIVLLSATSSHGDLPDSIKAVCPKSAGVDAVLQKALAAIDLTKNLAMKKSNHSLDLGQGRNVS